MKLICKKTDFDKNSASDKSLWINLPRKMPTIAAMRFLRNQQFFEEMEKKQLSCQNFGKESDFETSF